MTTQPHYPTRHRCPICGAVLLSNGRDVWCERAAYSAPACVYGLEYSVKACARCGGPLDNVSPGFSIVEGAGKVCAHCVRPGEEIARAKGL